MFWRRWGSRISTERIGACGWSWGDPRACVGRAGVTQPILGPAPTFLQEGFGSPHLDPTQKDVCGSLPCSLIVKGRQGARSSRTGRLCWGRGGGRAPSAFVTKTAQPGREEGRWDRTSCLHLLLELRGRGLPPTPPGCWLAVGPVLPSGSELRGHPRVCPLVTCVVLRMFCCRDRCAVSPPVPSRPAIRVTACPPFVVSDVCNQTQPCH